MAKPAIPTIFQTANSIADAPAKDGRDSTGRFVKGQYKGGPGNPFAGKVNSFRSAIFKATTKKQVVDAWKELIAVAMTCDDPRVKLNALEDVLEYTVGKPAGQIDVTIEHSGLPVVIFQNDFYANANLAAGAAAAPIAGAALPGEVQVSGSRPSLGEDVGGAYADS